MRVLVFSLLFIGGVVTHAADDRPSGPNCNLRGPPKNAGEEFNHGITLKIYLRARDMSKNYTGCQILWMPDGRGWLTVSVVAIEREYAVRLWSPMRLTPLASLVDTKREKLFKETRSNAQLPNSLL